MKRSEMVDHMTRHWLGLFPNEPIEHMVASEVFDDVREKMSSLLKLLEHKGMLPPTRSRSLTNALGDTAVYEANIWESET